MNCELVHEQIVTAAYGELPDEQVRELELHLADCPECQQERKQLLALKALAEAYPVVEPDANLVARARLRLDEALDALPPKRWHERLGQWMRNNFASLQAAPVAACLLLVAGAGAGSLGGFELAQHRAARTAAVAQLAAVLRVPTTPFPGKERYFAAMLPEGAKASNAAVSYHPFPVTLLKGSRTVS
jgi:anti-sigma factor RsiW